MRGMEVCRFIRFGRVSALLQEHPSTQVDTAGNSLVRIHLSRALPVLACVIVVPYKGCLAVGAFTASKQLSAHQECALNQFIAYGTGSPITSASAGNKAAQTTSHSKGSLSPLLHQRSGGFI